jgi:hypothetical protein
MQKITLLLPDLRNSSNTIGQFCLVPMHQKTIFEKVKARCSWPRSCICINNRFDLEPMERPYKFLFDE